jgi:hypothetical protein
VQVVARAKSVGVSLVVASICWMSGHRDRRGPEIEKGLDSGTAAVVCNGEDYDEDEDG